ncbi:Histidinol-phosphate aminotransferase [subsurface metagenome]
MAAIGNLLKVKLPFEPSRPAQAAALAALEDKEYLERSLRNNREGMDYLQAAFERLGLEYVPSAANFLILRLPSEEAAARLTDRLLSQGVILRHLAPFGWPTLIRVTVGLQEENAYFVEQVEGVLSADR